MRHLIISIILGLTCVGTCIMASYVLAEDDLNSKKIIVKEIDGVGEIKITDNATMRIEDCSEPTTMQKREHMYYLFIPSFN